MSFADGEPLHGRELVGARRVRDLERADVLVAADHLQRRRASGGVREEGVVVLGREASDADCVLENGGEGFCCWVSQWGRSIINA